METNFFSQLKPLLQGSSKIVISFQIVGDKVVASVMPHAKPVKDEVVKSLPPLLISGTEKELDSSFFESISSPIKKATVLFSDIESYEKQIEVARENSDMEKKKKQTEKEAKDKEKKIIEENDKKVVESMKTSDGLPPQERLEILSELKAKGKAISDSVMKKLDDALGELKKTNATPTLF